jgi:membrane protease YdiL (CAAX protease family)
MTGEATTAPGRRIRARDLTELLAFLGVTYAITWIICGVYIFMPKPSTALLGAMKTGSPIFFVAVYAPSLTAIGLTAALGRWRGLCGLGAATIRFAGRWPWILASLFGYPAIWLAVAVIQALAEGRPLTAVSYDHWYGALPMVVFSGFVFRDAGPLGEELGWRGYALPRLLKLTGPRRAAVLLGAIWAVWHVPAFYLSGLSQSKFHFESFFLVVVGFSVFMTAIYLNTRGSVLLAGVIPHMWFNAVSKAGIHPIDGVTIALAAALLLLGGPIWRSPDVPDAHRTTP